MSGALNHYIDGHEGSPAVVLLHPICTSSEIWRLQLPVWAEQFRVIRIDLRGHGLSPTIGRGLSTFDFADAVLETLNSIGVDRVAVVGISLGAMVAQAFALKYPERTTALVSAHASAKTPPEVSSAWDRRLAEHATLGVGSHVESTLARWFGSEFRQRAPLTVGWVERLIRETPFSGYCEAVDAIKSLDHAHRLSEIGVPSLVLGGRHDIAVVPEVVTRVAESIPRSKCVLIDSGHIGNVEAGAEFTEIVGGFLRTHTQAGVTRFPQEH
jgi:3-oxoadipate enol-lactonase